MKMKKKVTSLFYFLSSPVYAFVTLDSTTASSYLDIPHDSGVKKVGSAKEIDGYEEASDDEQEMDAIHSELLGNGTENIDSDSDSDAEGNGEKKKGEKEVDSDDDSDIDDAPAKQSSKSSKAPPVMKTPAKKSSRVSFGTGQQSTLGIPHHTTAGMKKSLSLGGEVGYDESEGWIEMLLSYPATTRRLLMVQLGQYVHPVVHTRLIVDTI